MSDMFKMQMPTSVCQNVVKKKKKNFIQMLISKHYKKPVVKAEERESICGGKVFTPIEGSQRL
jgi:hypothetical protein